MLLSREALASLYTAEYVRKGDYKGMLNSMREAFKYNVFRNGEEQMYFQNNIEALAGCDDRDSRAGGNRLDRCQMYPDKRLFCQS